MKKQSYQFEYEEYNSMEELNAEDALLLKLAKEETIHAYAPYSHFSVAAVARLSNGQIVKGTNQENASYPVGICAERVLMSTAASLFPGMAISTMAISYKSSTIESNKPVSPCGMCRQALAEFEDRTAGAIRLVLGGETGAIIVVNQSRQLLPFNFGKEDLEKS
ncbi:MAG: cytidine deaminase [Chitinophagaceae bacterium]